MEARGKGIPDVVVTVRYRFGGAKKRAAAVAKLDGEETIGEEEGMPLETMKGQ